MPYICIGCLEVYSSNPDIRGLEEIRCPKRGCFNIVAEIDEGLVEVIIELNKKGYITSMCCEGHARECNVNTFISFFNEECFPKIAPKEFSRETQNNYFIIRKKYRRTENYIETQRKIMHGILDLLDWVEALPPNQSIIDFKKHVDTLNANNGLDD